MRHRHSPTALVWKQDGYLHFAHARYGMWTIEQDRRKFIVTLDLKGTRDATQEMGTYCSLALAKTGVKKDHRELDRLDG
jgi:hypothetical protein